MTTYEPLSDIEAWFNENPPTAICSVQEGAVILFPDRFVKTNIELLKANSGNKAFNPYFKRLHLYYEFCRYGVVPESHLKWEEKAKKFKI